MPGQKTPKRINDVGVERGAKGLLSTGESIGFNGVLVLRIEGDGHAYEP